MSEDASWMDPDINDVSIPEGEFESELFISTDGKHTIKVKATTNEGRRSGARYAQNMYKWLVQTYGSKQSYASKEYKKADEEQKKDKKDCTHPPDATTIKTSSGRSKPENAGRRYKSCLDCGSFISWV